MKRCYNFAAGPGTMPLEVLEQAQREFTDWQGRGLSLLEMPFTGDDFKGIMRRARTSLRRLLNIPERYHILFMAGGASAQFALVPLNLLGTAGRADYIETGHWSRRASGEAGRYCAVNVAASTSGRLPQRLRLDPGAAYCHFTSNETADGVQFHAFPACGDVPLVADMTSDFLTRPLEVEKFGLIYASAQKNIGPAGFTVVIVRDDLCDRALPATPTVFNYGRQQAAESLLNTPATFAVYLADLVFQWVIERGGLGAMAERSRTRSEQIYRIVDESDGFYRALAAPDCRSRVNICFTLAAELEPVFLAEAAAHGLINLKGHGALGGIRASLYNAMPDAGVSALAGFMQAFAAQHANAV